MTYSRRALKASVQTLLCCLRSRFWEAVGQRLLPGILPELTADCQVHAELPAPFAAAAHLPEGSQSQAAWGMEGGLPSKLRMESLLFLGPVREAEKGLSRALRLGEVFRCKRLVKVVGLLFVAA